MASSFIYGYHPVREILRNRPHAALEVLVTRRRAGKRLAEIEALARRHQVALREVAEAELRDQAGRGSHSLSHNGFGLRLAIGNDAVLALGSVVEAGVEGAGVEGAVVETGDRDLQVLVEDIQDPRNLGALLRVCEGAGVGQVLLRDRGSAPLTAAAVRTSAGASEWLDLARITNSAREIERLKAEGFWVYGAAAGGVPPWECDLTGKVLLCLGGEKKGLRQRTRGLCDHLVGLPMRGRVESLNLATAAAALLYEALRQRISDKESR